MNIVDTVRIIVEKALRYVSPDRRATGLDNNPALLRDIIPSQDVDGFVERLCVEAQMMNLPLDELAIRHYLHETQCAIPVSTLPTIVWNAITSRRLQEEFKQTQEQLQRMQAQEQIQNKMQMSDQRADEKRARAWTEAMPEEKEMAPPASPAAASVPPPAPEPAQSAATPTPDEGSGDSPSEPSLKNVEVKWFKDAKGFGFTSLGKDGEDIFVHYSARNTSDFKSLQEGQRVYFEVVKGPKGWQASDLEPLAAQPAATYAPAPPADLPAVSAPAAPAKGKHRESGQHKLNRIRPKRPGVDGREYDATIVKVFYATDRRRASGPAKAIEYDWQQSPTGKLEYGECEVSIPETHVTGGMESPSLLKFEFRPDPEKHIVLWKTTSVEEEAFYEQVSASVAQSEMKDAFVFVHGYNVSFEDAARRTGQFAYDLKFLGAPIFYSWPSNGKVADYMKDENNIIWTTPHFETFLHRLSERSGAERVHIIAHSMGNRAVCEALRALSYDPNLQLKLTHLVLAAPDIDAGTFSELAALLQKHSKHVTLYESNNDRALMASKKLHGNPRAGEPILVIAGMDTIDASAVDTDFLGHSYWSEEWEVMSDIHSMLESDEPAAKRFGLSARENVAGEYFEFQRTKS